MERETWEAGAAAGSSKLVLLFNDKREMRNAKWKIFHISFDISHWSLKT
jgi:hypothetical protein